MTRSELERLIADLRQHAAEPTTVEVKDARGGTPKRLYEPLSAFANQQGGGIILFGLDETHGFESVGVGNAARLQEDVSGLGHEMEPPVRPRLTLHDFEGKTLVVAEVPAVPAQRRPCHYRPAGLQGGSYIRSGNTNRHMTDYEIFGYVSSREQPSFDGGIVPGSGVEDLDEERIQDYLRLIRDRRPDVRHLDQPLPVVLEHLRIARGEDGVIRPTLAGLLAFGQYPQRFEPQLVITFLQYYGGTPDELTPRGERFLDNRKFEGPLPDMIDSAVRHVMVSIRKSSLIEGLYRRDIPEYPEEAVREAVVNAVAHRDYSNYVRGTYVQIRLFADRLEVQSPGGLYGNVTEETLETEHSTRNRTLMRFLEDLRVAENRGSGIAAMIRAMREANLEPPRFQDRRSSFLVVFRNHSLMNPDAIAWLNQFSDHPLNDLQRLALAYMRTNSTMTNSDYRRLNRVDSATATRELRGLVNAGLVRQRGTRGGAYYILDAPAEIPEEVRTETPESRILTYVREHGAITNAQCRALLRTGRRQTYRLLRRMVDTGVLRLDGATRGARYVPVDGDCRADA